MGGEPTDHRRQAALLVAGLLLTLTIAYVATSEHAIAGERRAGTYAVTCLPAARAEERDGACRTPLGATDDRRGEGMLAVHPDDPGIIVLAAVTSISTADAEAQADPPPGEPPADNRTSMQRFLDEVNETIGREPSDPPAEEPPPPGRPCPTYGICLHVTEDGGATWRSRAVAGVDGRPPRFDPTIAFTSDGILHVVSLVLPQGIGYARTADLGRTWEGETLLADGSVDRPWLGTDGDRLVVSHQDGRNAGPLLHTYLLYSADGGHSWQRLDHEPLCALNSAPLYLSGERWLTGCLQVVPARLRLHEVDLRTGTTREHRTLGSSYNPSFLSGTAERIVLARAGGLDWFRDTVNARVSTDQGRTWHAPVDLLALTPIDDDWDWQWVTAVGTDANGNAHVLIVGGTGENCYNQLCDSPGEDHEVLWVAVDPVTGDLLGEALLGAGTREGAAPRPHALDDYHHIVPYGHGMLLAWSHDGQASIAWVRPT